MSNLIFKVEHEVYRSQADYGIKQVKKLCELVGAEFVEKDYYYGFFDAVYNKHNLCITVKREIARIDVRLDGIWNYETKVKFLTEKKLQNIKAKFDSLIQDKIRSDAIIEERSKLSEFLSKFNIVLRQDGYFEVNNIEFKLDSDGSIKCVSGFDIREYLYDDCNFKEKIQEIEKDFYAFQSNVKKCEDIVKLHINKITKYYELLE